MQNIKGIVGINKYLRFEGKLFSAQLLKRPKLYVERNRTITAVAIVRCVFTGTFQLGRWKLTTPLTYIINIPYTTSIKFGLIQSNDFGKNSVLVVFLK